MRTIGLTGGIACGKSHVADVLRSLGAAVVDGDALSRALTAPGGRALPEIRRSFGSGVFREDGALDRKALGALVFSDPAALSELNRLMEPLLMEAIGAAVEEAQRSGASFCVMDMPLLFEKGLDRSCSRIWCVTVPEEVQIARVMERDGLTREQALARIRSQLPTAEKAARSDVVIDTNHPIEYTDETIRRLWAEETARGG